jgi:monoamine oxidase
MWVGPTQTRILELIKGYRLELVPQYVKGKNILEASGKRSTADVETLGFEPATKAEYQRVVREVTMLSDQVPLEAPWTMQRAEEYDHMTAQEWFQTQTKDKTLLAYLQEYTRTIFTVDAYQISFLYFLFYQRSGDNFETLSGYANAAQAWTVNGTLHQVAARMAADLARDVVLEAPVREISQRANGVVVKSDKGLWEGEYAIVAVPLPLSIRIAYQPELPPERDILAQHMPMGSVIKYWVAYEKPFWRDRDLNGVLQSDEPPSQAISADGTPPEGRPGLLVGFIEAHNALKWTGRP